jgi:hypothetical protein
MIRYRKKRQFPKGSPFDGPAAGEKIWPPLNDCVPEDIHHIHLSIIILILFMASEIIVFQSRHIQFIEINKTGAFLFLIVLI